MAQTAVVNKRRRRRRKNNPRRRRARRHNYGAAATPNRRRRRRAPNRHHRRRGRRRNPSKGGGRSPYSTGGYYRAPNPGTFNFDEVMDVLPAATGGVWAGRFALKQAGAFEPGQGGVLQPGLKHAFALWIAATFGGKLIGDLLGDAHKGQIATIGCFGFAGDLFLRTRFMRDSQFVQQHLSLQGLGNGEEEGMVSGFQQQSALGQVDDAAGNRWVQTAQGWQLAGMGDGGQLVQGPDGQIYQLSGGDRLDSRPGAGSRLDGFQAASSLGGSRRAYANPDSSFGYVPGV